MALMHHGKIALQSLMSKGQTAFLKQLLMCNMVLFYRTAFGF